MKIFGKERQSLRIKKAKTARAMFMDGPGTEEIEIRLLTEENQILDLQLRPQLAHQLIMELTGAYEAICPPLRRGDYQASWNGMME